jgi:IS5 family transposase
MALREHEIHETKTRNQYHFGKMAPTGADAESGRDIALADNRR